LNQFYQDDGLTNRAWEVYSVYYMGSSTNTEKLLLLAEWK